MNDAILVIGAVTALVVALAGLVTAIRAKRQVLDALSNRPAQPPIAPGWVPAAAVEIRVVGLTGQEANVTEAAPPAPAPDPAAEPDP